jgi:hypothetical protein
MSNNSMMLSCYLAMVHFGRDPHSQGNKIQVKCPWIWYMALYKCHNITTVSYISRYNVKDQAPTTVAYWLRTVNVVSLGVGSLQKENGSNLNYHHAVHVPYSWYQSCSNIKYVFSPLAGFILNVQEKTLFWLYINFCDKSRANVIRILAVKEILW